MNRKIRKVAVLGSGVMGSRIACHFANAGVEVLLLDIIPKHAPPDDKTQRNSIVNAALAAALQSTPSPIYSPSFACRIQTGNTEDDMAQIAGCDWIIEVIVERLDIKKQVFDRVEQFRKPGTLISSNTSGIPIYLMTEGRSDDFRQHFCGTHFFNPPRYLRLLEIIPTADTLPEVIAFLMEYGSCFLGKTTVCCKDTPAFISNRIGVFSMASILRYVSRTGMTIDEVDSLTGSIAGRPKSATFRTADVVGIDTLALVADGLAQTTSLDESPELFTLPDFISKMIANNWLGNKSGQGFFKKIKTTDDQSEIHTLNLQTMEYQPAQKIHFPVPDVAKSIENIRDRFKLLLADPDRPGDFYRSTFYELFAYASHHIPEISDELYKIDDAVEAGFGWEAGPFKIWDALDVAATVAAMEATGHKPAQWVYDMLASHRTSFYQSKNGHPEYFDIFSKKYQSIPGTMQLILLKNLPETAVVWKNAGTTITDIGDGILNLAFHTKMNTIDADVLQGINKAIDLAETSWQGLVIANEGSNFSSGANVGLIFMLAAKQEYEELDFAIRRFQNTMMRIRYSSVPVVAAPHNMTLGGGCEICLHADKVVAHAESYIGLVEFSIGLIPGGGGTKEFALRLSDELRAGDIAVNRFRDRFMTIGQAKVSSSAVEAFDLDYLLPGRDKIVMYRSRQLADAKQECLQMAHAGYCMPIPRKDIIVLGKSALGLVYTGAGTMLAGNYISEHDVKIAHKLGYVLAGGNLSQPTEVSEQYLLDLEREALLSLCTEKKTLERIRSVLAGGRIIRN